MNFYKLKGNLNPRRDAETTHLANRISVNEYKKIYAESATFGQLCSDLPSILNFQLLTLNDMTSVLLHFYGIRRN